MGTFSEKQADGIEARNADDGEDGSAKKRDGTAEKPSAEYGGNQVILE